MRHLWFRDLLLPDGWAASVRVGIDDGLVASVSAGTSPEPNDDRVAIGVPGLPNLHSHAFQRAMAGLTERRGPTADSFWTWRDTMYRQLSRMSPDDVEAIAALAYVEMLERGFTSVGEFHYLHRAPDGAPYDDPAEMAGRIAAAAHLAGIRLTLLPALYVSGGFGGAPLLPGQRRFVTPLNWWPHYLTSARDHLARLPDAVLGIAPHSLRAVPPEALETVLGTMPNGPVHIHVAEQTKEVDDCLAWCGQRPVEWLLEHAPVDARWCLIHATHVTPAELGGIAERGAVVGLCPVTEANLGDGLFPAAAFRDRGGTFGIGSDSNVQVDAAAELRMLEYGQRLVTRGRNVLAERQGESTGMTLFQAALAGGSQALGVAPGIRVGNPADFVSFDPDHPSLVAGGAGDLLDAWVFAGASDAIDRVWRRGAVVVSGGRHRDGEAIRERYRRALRRLREDPA